MARRNRVSPLSELIATPARGLVYGNRGCLPDEEGRIRRRYNGKRWIACRLRFKDWHRSPLLQPGKFTELFFLDEATAFAAGHRPCALCRREDYNRFLSAWQTIHPGATGADAVDAQLHDERVDPQTRGQLHHEQALPAPPGGTFVVHHHVPPLVVGDRLLRWSPAGYSSGTPRPASGAARVITPPSLVETLRGGWESAVAVLQPSVDRS